MHQTHGPAVDPSGRGSCDRRPQRVSSGIRLFRNSAFLHGCHVGSVYPGLRFLGHRLSAYMCLSRVKRCEDVCVTQAFSKNLFQNGELIGPHTYLEFHRKKLSLAQAKARFEKDAPKRKRQPDVMLYCRNCSPRSNMPDRLLPLRDREAWYKVLEEGMDRLCTQCRSPESGKQPPTPTDGPDACAHCRGKHGPPTTAGFCRRCLATVRLSRARCDKGKKIPTKTLRQFTPEEIRRKKATIMCGVPAARPVLRRRLQPRPSKASAPTATKP